MTQAGQTTLVDWMGNVPSPDLRPRSTGLPGRPTSPVQGGPGRLVRAFADFVYADAAGNIGAISAGYYPQVAAACQPWLPMPRHRRVRPHRRHPLLGGPQAYDPASHVLATANQRPVTAAYPYYIGTSANFFDPGYRAATIYAALARAHAADPGQFRRRTDEPDRPARRPHRAKVAVRAAPRPLSSTERAVVSLLRTWTARLWAPIARRLRSGGRSGAITSRRSSSRGGPTPRSAPPRTPGGCGVPAGQPSLDEDLEAWTLDDPANPAFSLPSRQRSERRRR